MLVENHHFSTFSHLLKKCPIVLVMSVRQSMTSRFSRQENAFFVTHCSEYRVIFFYSSLAQFFWQKEAIWLTSALNY
jgi:hypothetical protein